MNDYDKFVDAFVVFKDSKSSNKLSIFYSKNPYITFTTHYYSLLNLYPHD